MLFIQQNAEGTELCYMLYIIHILPTLSLILNGVQQSKHCFDNTIVVENFVFD